MRRMVVSCHATVANYEYLVYWRFYQDGNIECEVRATGLMVTTPFAEGEPTPPARAPWSTSAPTRRSTSTSWSPGSTWTSTATTNTVMEVDSRALPVSDGEPVRAGRGHRGDPGPLGGRVGAATSTGRPSARWKVVNPNRTNAARHQPVAYKLVPGAVVPADDGPGRRRSTCARR